MPLSAVAGTLRAAGDGGRVHRRDEVTVGIVVTGRRRVGIMRIVPRQKSPNFVYSLRSSGTMKDCKNMSARRIEPGVAQKVAGFSLKA